MRKAWLKYIAALFLFGSNGIVASHIHLTSYEIVLLRTLLGSLLLMVLFFVGGGRLTVFQHRHALFCLLGSGAAMAASWMFLYEAYQQIGVSMATLAYYCGPVLVMALSPVFFREALTPARLTGFLFVLCGVFLLNGLSPGGEHRLWGGFCGLMSAVLYAVMVICNKKSHPVAGLENAMLQLLISFLTTAIFVGFKQGYAIQLTSSALVPVLLLGLVNTGLGCYFYFSSIGALPVQTVAVCGYLEPLSAVVFSALFLGEILHPVQLCGGALILGGALFGECAGQKRRSCGQTAQK